MKKVFSLISVLLICASAFATTATVSKNSVIANGPVSHNITLSWTQSISPNLVKNTVYRAQGTCPATLQKLVDIQPPATTYIDTNVISGTVYCYAVTATDNISESSPSSTVQVTVPGPQPPQNPTGVGN